MSTLVKKLAETNHRIVVRPRADDPLQELRRRITSGYVHVKFPDTQGGTELGVSLSPDLTDITGADFASGSGTVRLVGTLKLDYIPVRCVADVQLSTLEGLGRLEILSDDEYRDARVARGD